MGTKYKAKPSSSKKEDYNYPSRFGSHKSMVDKGETEKLAEPALSVCKDEYGLYVTDTNRLDDRMADPNRWMLPEDREKRLQQVAGEVFDIVMHPAAE